MCLGENWVSRHKLDAELGRFVPSRKLLLTKGVFSQHKHDLN